MQPNTRDIAGLTAGIEAAGLARSFNVPLHMGGNWPDMDMHLHGAIPDGGRVEFRREGWKMVTELFDGAPDPADYYVTLPDQPGLGIHQRKELYRGYAVD